MKRKELLSFIKENQTFDLLWASQILSQITLNMINYVMATRIYERTGSTVAVSLLWVFGYLPAFFLGPFSGLLVDLWDLRKILLVTNFLQGLTMLLFLTIGNRLYPIYPIVFLYSLLNQFYNPAEAASIPWLVKRKDLPTANSLFMLTMQSALIFGLGVSGLLMRFLGQNKPIWISAACLFLAAVAVYFLPRKNFQKKDLSAGLSEFWEEIKSGYSFVKNTRIILFPILLAISFQVFLVVLGVSLPEFASNILKIQLQDAGPLLIIPLGLGALCGTFVMNKFAYKFRKRTLMKRGLSVIFSILFFFSVILPFLGRYKLVAAIPLMFLAGLGGFFIAVPNQTLIQEHTPEHLRGRVYGTLGFLGNMVVLPCLLFTATVVDFIGVGTFMFLMAGLVMVMFLVFDRMESYILTKRVKTVSASQ